jgi:hypothetical protein
MAGLAVRQSGLVGAGVRGLPQIGKATPSRFVSLLGVRLDRVVRSAAWVVSGKNDRREPSWAAGRTL